MLFFDFPWDTRYRSISVPEGYELREKPEHKKERLKQEEKSLKARKETLLRLLDEVEKKSEEVKKELE